LLLAGKSALASVPRKIASFIFSHKPRGEKGKGGSVTSAAGGNGQKLLGVPREGKGGGYRLGLDTGGKDGNRAVGGGKKGGVASGSTWGNKRKRRKRGACHPLGVMRC